MTYEINYGEGELVGCSSKIIMADRIFYIKLFSTGTSKFFSGDQQGVIQKEISKAEFELWINILVEKEADMHRNSKKA